MIILGTLVVVVIAGVIWQRYDNLSVMADIMAIMGGIILAVALLAVPVGRLSVHADIAKFSAVKETAVMARGAEHDWELAAFQAEIASANRWLAGVKYWNSTAFDLWVPDEIENLEPIQ